MNDPTAARAASSRNIRVMVAGFSVLAGLAILGPKYWAYRISGSAALMSDAIEGVVNVVAAVFALGAVIFAERPPDAEHPYGHGKIEHFSAAFEGGLISLAAALILWEAIDTLIHGSQIRNLEMGILVNVGAGLLNGLLGLFLVRMGRRHSSRAIEADGHHVLSDFWTTVGLALGLLIVRFTGLHWVDPLLAIGVSVLLAGTGFRLVRASSQALLDREDPELLARLVDVLNRIRPPDLIAVHELRTMRAGRSAYVDVHVVVPEFYEIRRAHDLAESVGTAVLAETGIEGQVHTHIDPCERAWCRSCRVEPCQVRVQPYVRPEPLTLAEAILPGSI
jgi:cation diffusion facilitator family transporter